jgi:hypothetical protein
MPHLRSLSWAALGLVSGCAAGAATLPPMAASASPLTAAALTGVWVEYWAPGGAADTERYQFDAGDQLVWDARRATSDRGPIHKHGAFRLEPASSPSELVVSVMAEDFAGCASCSAEAGAPRHVEHAQPIIERYELGECAPNVEAQARDAHYACVAIGGHAFWRQPPSAASAR